MASSDLFISDPIRHIVTGVVYAPGLVDMHGEAMTADEIRAAAYRFMLSGLLDRVDTGHSRIRSGSRVVESFVARATDTDFPPGAWVVSVKVYDPALWDSIVRGTYAGFSMEGYWRRSPTTLRTCIPVAGFGSTETCEAPPGLHAHQVSLEFDDQGRLIPCSTAISLGHSHLITGATATEQTLGHRHGLRIVNRCP